MDIKIFSNMRMLKHVLILCLFVVNALSIYTPLSNDQTCSAGNNQSIVSTLKDSLKDNELKSSEDLRAFRDAAFSLKVFGEEYSRTEKAIQGYKNYEIDHLYSTIDCFYISELTGSCENNQIFKTFNAHEPESESEMLSMIRDYYYIFNIYKGSYKNSEKANDFMQTLGAAFVKHLYPKLTTNLDLKFKNKSVLTKEVGYMLEMVNFFKDVAKDANKGHMEKIVAEGLSRLLSKSVLHGNDRRAFVSHDLHTSDLELNSVILKGVLSFGAEGFVRDNSQIAKGFYNWLLSKKAVLKDSKSFYNLHALRVLGEHIPTFEVNIHSFPEKLTVRVVDYRGNKFVSNDFKISGTAKRIKARKDSSFTLTHDKDNVFSVNNIETTGAGVYQLTLTIETSHNITFTEQLSVVIEGKVEFDDISVTEGAVSFKIKIDGEQPKAQVDHAFVEYRHKENKEFVFVDAENIYLNGKYTFKRILVDRNYPSGDYDVYIGCHDLTLKQPVTQKAGKTKNTNGVKGYKDSFASKESFNQRNVIENLFDPEVDYLSQYSIPMFLFVGLHVIALIWYLKTVFAGKFKISSTGYFTFLLMIPVVLFFVIYWTKINLMQALALLMIGAPYLVFVLWLR